MEKRKVCMNCKWQKDGNCYKYNKPTIETHAVEFSCCEFPVTELEKPPIGLRPKYVLDYERKTEILDAMERYANAGVPIPMEWVTELRELLC